MIDYGITSQTGTEMPTLLLTPRYTDDSQLLWRAAQKLGWGVERLLGWRVPEHFKDMEEPVLYVDTVFAHHIAEQMSVTLEEPPENWLPELPEIYRKREVKLTKLSEVKRGPVFVKPPNDKSFPAKVYQSEELLDLDPNLQVLVAEPVEWTSEYRCFMLNGRVLTVSVYLRNGVTQKECDYAALPRELTDAGIFAAVIATNVRTPRAIVMDVGVIKDRGWAVVELNAPWGSGIYGCNPTEVLPVIKGSMKWLSK